MMSEIPTTAKQYKEVVDFIVLEKKNERVTSLAGITKKPMWIHFMAFSGDEEAERMATDWLIGAAAMCKRMSTIVYKLTDKSIMPPNINVTMQPSAEKALTTMQIPRQFNSTIDEVKKAQQRG